MTRTSHSPPPVGPVVKPRQFVAEVPFKAIPVMSGADAVSVLLAIEPLADLPRCVNNGGKIAGTLLVERHWFELMHVIAKVRLRPAGSVGLRHFQR